MFSHHWLYQKNPNFVIKDKNIPIPHNIVLHHNTHTILEWAIDKFDFNEKDKDGNTALHVTCCQNENKDAPMPYYWIFDESLSRTPKKNKFRIDINAINNDGQTVLHYAANKKDFGTVKNLIVLGADVNSQDDLGRTPLMLALENKCEGAVRCLLKNHADQTIKDSNGNTCKVYIQYDESASDYLSILHEYKK